MVRERNGALPSYAEAKKVKSQAVHSNCCLLELVQRTAVLLLKMPVGLSLTVSSDCACLPASLYVICVCLSVCLPPVCLPAVIYVFMSVCVCLPSYRFVSVCLSLSSAINIST